MLLLAIEAVLTAEVAAVLEAGVELTRELLLAIELAMLELMLEALLATELLLSAELLWVGVGAAVRLLMAAATVSLVLPEPPPQAVRVKIREVDRVVLIKYLDNCMRISTWQVGQGAAQFWSLLLSKRLLNPTRDYFCAVRDLDVIIVNFPSFKCHTVLVFKTCIFL